MTAPWHRRLAETQTAIENQFGNIEHAKGYNAGREDAYARKDGIITWAGIVTRDFAKGYQAGYQEVIESRAATQANPEDLPHPEYVRGFNTGYAEYEAIEEAASGLFLSGPQPYVRGYLDGRNKARDASIKRHGARCI